MEIGEIKETYNRYNDSRFLKRISDKDYLVYGNSEFTRSGHYDENKYVDFEGAPFLIEKDDLRYWNEDDLIIDKIENWMCEEANVCYKITVK